MKKFRITIDGKTYNVEVEDVSQGETNRPTLRSQPSPVAVETQKPENSPRPSGGSGSLSAPMPGTILKVLVNKGEQVQVGQPLIILEAMKMENKINASATGKVASIEVSAGQSVDTGQLLLTIE